MVTFDVGFGSLLVCSQGVRWVFLRAVSAFSSFEDIPRIRRRFRVFSMKWQTVFAAYLSD